MSLAPSWDHGEEAFDSFPHCAPTTRQTLAGGPVLGKWGGLSYNPSQLAQKLRRGVAKGILPSSRQEQRIEPLL